MAASVPRRPHHDVVVLKNDDIVLDGFLSRIPAPENKELGPRYCFKSPDRAETVIFIKETRIQRDHRMEIRAFVVEDDTAVVFIMRDSPEILYRGITTDCDRAVMERIYEMFVEDNPWLAPAYEAFQRTAAA
jgi:hypothetical protein